MNTPKKTNLSDWADRETFTVGEAAALWGGWEPRVNHLIYPCQRPKKLRLQEVLVILGHKTQQPSPPPEPRFWERFPRDVWIQVAGYMEERPLFLFPRDAAGATVGRKSRADDILAVYMLLVEGGKIKHPISKRKCCPIIRKLVMEKYPVNNNAAGLSDETIRTAIREEFDRNEEAAKVTEN